jgi:hypothetical protein
VQQAMEYAAVGDRLQPPGHRIRRD